MKKMLLIMVVGILVTLGIVTATKEKESGMSDEEISDYYFDKYYETQDVSYLMIRLEAIEAGRILRLDEARPDPTDEPIPTRAPKHTDDQIYAAGYQAFSDLADQGYLVTVVSYEMYGNSEYTVDVNISNKDGSGKEYMYALINSNLYCRKTGTRSTSNSPDDRYDEWYDD